MSDDTVEDKSKSAKDEGEKHPGHVNAVAYAAADSVFKSRLWSIGVSLGSYLLFKWGLNNKSTEQTAIRAAEIVTLPEKGIKALYSNITGKPVTPPDLRRNAPLTTALTIGPLVEYIVAIPYFRAALKKINKINAANDAVRAENVRLKGGNIRSDEALPAQEGETAERAKNVPENTAAAKIVSGGKPVSHAEAVTSALENPQQPIR